MATPTNKDGRPGRSPQSCGAGRGNGPSWWKLLVRRHRTLVVVLFALVVLGLLAGIGGIAYTFTPGFCTTCHIMEPYFESWRTSPHGESDIGCLKCHYSPGFVNTVRGKMKGISELVVFLTVRHLHRFASSIEDAGPCLRTGCHDARLLEGETQYAGTRFDHTPHLTEERRGKQLRCTSCHSQIVQGAHIAVTATTCYLCHFKNEPLGQDLANCLLCHSVPDTAVSLPDGSEFDHVGAEAEAIGCTHCHAKDVRGEGIVPEERCTVCHQDPEHLRMYHDSELMHENHVTGYKIECLDCHLSINHGRLELPAALDCSVCHLEPHVATEHLLAGVGEGVDENPSRKHLINLTCESCHQEPVAGLDGSLVLGGGAKSCDGCHGEGTGELIAEWEDMIAESLEEVGAEYNRVRGELESYSDTTGESYIRARERFERAERNYALVEKGHAVHNPDFASELLDAVAADLEETAALIRGS